MKIDEARTRDARARHAEGQAALDKLFGYDRRRDGTGFLLAAQQRTSRFWRRPKK